MWPLLPTAMPGLIFCLPVPSSWGEKRFQCYFWSFVAQGKDIFKLTIYYLAVIFLFKGQKNLWHNGTRGCSLFIFLVNKADLGDTQMNICGFSFFGDSVFKGRPAGNEIILYLHFVLRQLEDKWRTIRERCLVTTLWKNWIWNRFQM